VGLVITAYQCNGCLALYEDSHSAFHCCPPMQQMATNTGFGWQMVNKRDILCHKCRHADPERKRYPPCPELSFTDNLYDECDQYEYAER